MPGSRDVAGFAPARWPRFGFELPGARQGFAPCPHAPAGAAPVRVAGSDDPGVVLYYRDVTAVAPVRVSTPVFLDFDEVADNFSTHASPTLYATQEVTVRLEAPPPATAAGTAPAVAIYALYYDAADRVQELRSSAQTLRPGANTLRWQVPPNGGMPLFRIGLDLTAPPGGPSRLAGSLRLLSVDWDGAPRDFRQRGMLMSSIWNLRPHWLRAWVSAAREFAPDFELTYCISHSADNGLVTLGTRDWRDYAVETRLRFSLHRRGGLVLRARGLRRYYAAVFSGGDRLAIVARHNDAVYTLAQASFAYEMERRYALYFAAAGNRLSLAVDGIPLLETRDDRYPSGGAGFVIDEGTMLADGFRVRRKCHNPSDGVPCRSGERDAQPS